jgi:hypothetical protein
MEKRKELEKKIEEIKYKIFIEQMADFMDWGAYYRLERKLREAERELAALGA